MTAEPQLRKNGSKKEFNVENNQPLSAENQSYTQSSDKRKSGNNSANNYQYKSYNKNYNEKKELNNSEES